MASSPDTAVVITDPQNDFLSPDGVTWELVGNSVTENRTVANLEALLRAAKSAGVLRSSFMFRALCVALT